MSESSSPACKDMILTVNGGSSSIKFALFDSCGTLRRILTGRLERIGLPDARLVMKGAAREQNFSRAVNAPDHTAAVFTACLAPT